MQASPVRDLTVGLFVLAGLAAIAYLSLQVGGLSYKGPGGFELTATFDEIGGLKQRALVVVAGVPVGRVEEISLDSDLRAVVQMDLDPGVELSIDTSAEIRTSGVLGDQFIALEPGAEDETLQPGDAVDFTRSAISLEQLIGKFVNNSGLED